MKCPQLTIAIATIALVGAACGGAPNPTPNPVPTATAAPAPTASPSASATAGATATASNSTASEAPSTSQTPTDTPPLPGSPSPSGQSETIHLILHPSSDTYVSVRSLTGCTDTTSCQGDYLIGNDPLFDASNGEEVGTLAYVEFVVRTGYTLFHSPANTINLTGRGQIVFTETLFDDGSGRPATAAIIGGTGEFLGVKGHVTSQSLPGKGDFVIEIAGWEAAPGEVPASAPPRTDPLRTIRVRQVVTDTTTVQVGSLTGCAASSCQGDYIIGNDPLVDSETGEEVGRFVYECFVVDPASSLYHCPDSTIFLTERGQIGFTAAIQPGSDALPTIGPVVGGTGEFSGVTGTVTGTKLATGDRDLLIEFSSSEAPTVSQAIHVLEEPVEFTEVSFGSLTGCTRTDGCQGDLLIGRSRMLDASTRAVAGSFVVACFLFDPDQRLYHCPANAITLSGRGQLVYTETLLFRVAPRTEWEKWAPWPIIGGTDEFLGVTGTVDSPADSTWSAGDFVVTIAN